MSFKKLFSEAIKKRRNNNWMNIHKKENEKFRIKETQ